MTEPERAWRRHRRRPWRTAIIIFAALHTVATHWPQLELGPEIPATDKTLHLVTFALATFLLWRTGWLRSRVLTCVVVIAWSGVDEITQGLPGLGRDVSWYDFAANVLGVLVMGAWLWALGPVGGAVNRHRLAVHEIAFDQAFLKPALWWRGVLAGAVCAVPAAATWWALDRPRLTAALIIIGLVVALHVGVWLVVRAWRTERAALIRTRPCLACNAPGPPPETACPVCGTTPPLGAWSEPAPATTGERWQMMRGPIFLGIGAAALLLVAIVIAPYFYARILESSPTNTRAPRVARTIFSVAAPLARSVDLTIMVTLAAIGTRLYRRRLGRYVEQGHWCRRCGHDLRQSPADDAGHGVCGECGREFRRAADAGGGAGGGS